MSTFGSAQYDTILGTVFSDASEPASPLKLQVAERLAAHRSHRSRVPGGVTAKPEPPARPAAERATRIAAAVAERYAKSPSYRAFLAAEAERAIQQAAAEAEAAARHAEAIACAQQQFLDDLETELKNRVEEQSELELCAQTICQPGPVTTTFPNPTKPQWQDGAAISAKSRAARETAQQASSALTVREEIAGLTIRLFEAEQPNRSLGPSQPALSYRDGRSRTDSADVAESLALDEEIAFRQNPVFEEAPEPAMPLPANLIEFPRQLVAARKARPRHAEGPLCAGAGEMPGRAQLRIFEVDPGQISAAAPVDTAAPEWSSIWLDAATPDLAATQAAQVSPSGLPTLHVDAPDPINPSTPLPAEFSETAKGRPRPNTASISRRLMAATLDGGLVLGALLTFAAGFAFATGVPASRYLFSREASLIAGQIGIPASCVAAAVALGFLYVVYHLLFFSLTEGTPGMRCARIAFCTFSNENPTRAALRRRIAAALLSACPLGLGFLWAALDEDRLSWHDRMTCMYPRSY